MRLGRGRYDSASDAVRYAKQHYIRPTVLTPDKRRVTARTEEAYQSVPFEGGRPNRHARRDLLTCGHFSAPCRPYQTLGEVCLDPNALFAQVLGFELRLDHHDHHADHHVTLIDADHRHHAHGQREWSAAGERALSHPLDKKERSISECTSTSIPFCRDQAGLKVIRGQLRELQDQRMAIQAGQDYRHYLTKSPRFGEKGDGKKAAGEMTIIPISTDHMGPSRKFTLAYDPETMTMQVKAKNLDQARTIANRKNQEYLQRLDAINVILTSLVNLKSRHLRTRNPLSNEVVQNLRKGPSTGPKINTMEKPSGTTLISLPIKPSHAPPSLTSIDQDSSGRSLHALGPINNHGSSVRYHDSHHPRPSRRLYTRQASVRTETASRMDTWDDIIYDGKLKARQRKPWIPDHRGSQFGLLRLHHPRVREEDKSCDVTVVRDQILDLKKVQASFSKQTQDKINKHLRDRHNIHEIKLDALRDLHPLWEEKRRQMDKIATNQLQQNQQEQGTIPRQVLEWYKILQDEATDQELYDSETILKLENLNRFATDEFLYLTNAKEKLCLLTLSLPIQEICTLAFRSAISFILNEIFHLPPDLLRQWLAYRHISHPYRDQ